MLRAWLTWLPGRLGRLDRRVIFAVCGVGAAFAAGYGASYLGGEQSGDVPIIRADASPVKVAPDHRGGMEIPHQDKLVYGRFGEGDESVEEQLLPAGEAPVEIVATSESDAAEAAPSEAAPTGGEVVATGGYVIQIAALGREEDALALFPRLRLKYPVILADLTADIQRAELEGGVFYRLRAGYFPDESSAQAVCAALKDGGQDCLVRRR